MTAHYIAEFYEALNDVEGNEKALQSWTQKRYETKFGYRYELQFGNMDVVLLEIVVADEVIRYDLIVPGASNPAVFKCAAQMVDAYAAYLQGKGVESFVLNLSGFAYQALIGLAVNEAIPVPSVGTLDGFDRHGNPKDVVVSKILRAVIQKRKP